MGHRDLGIHSEMCSDNVIPLIERDIINGRRKNFKPRKIIVGFLLGTKQLFDFVHDNPQFEFQPTYYTNDPALIARNDNMIAINSALQIDITGQVCADSVGQKFYSGFGGQVDFMRGAAHSKGGKPIIALPSTAKGGTISRIVPMLDAGAGVVTSRADVHYVITEYGVAYLHPRSRPSAAALLRAERRPTGRPRPPDDARGRGLRRVTDGQRRSRAARAGDRPVGRRLRRSRARGGRPRA